MRGQRLVLAAAVVVALVLALFAGGVGGLGARDDHHESAPCHAQVNCAGQAINAPLGAASLPVTVVAVLTALAIVARLELRPARWHDRLAAGRLFRPPRLLG